MLFLQKRDIHTDGRTDGPTDRRTDRRTDGPTDGRTDTPSYRDARTHLKTTLQHKNTPQIQSYNNNYHHIVEKV